MTKERLKRRRQSLRRKLFVEMLEDRRLLAVSTLPWTSVGPDVIIDSASIDTIVPPVPGGAAFNHAVSGAINVALPLPVIPGTPLATSANTIFVGTVNGGIWKTTNALPESWNGQPGPDWVNLTPNESSLSITDLEFSRELPGPIPPTPVGQKLVAGIGATSSYALQGGPNHGLLYSTNGGMNWESEDADGKLAGRFIRAVAAIRHPM